MRKIYKQESWGISFWVGGKQYGVAVGSAVSQLQLTNVQKRQLRKGGATLV